MVKEFEAQLDTRLWESETYIQRMTSKEWRWCLLHCKDSVTYQGKIRQLMGRRVFPGVVEVSKVPLHDRVKYIDARAGETTREIK